jgi:uncharacterized repeat protein (TIGR01451 family)
LSYSIDTNTRPLIQFSVMMQIVDSNSGSEDQFWWLLRNAVGHTMFGLEFDNSIKFIDYFLDNGGGPQAALPFYNFSIYNLLLLIDFGRNRWDAYLNGTLMVIEQPITTSGAALTLGDIDAVWVVNNSFAPGNNYLLFDNYSVTAGPTFVPRILAGPQNQTVAAGSDVFLGAAAAGTAPLTYQWSYNNGAIPSATNASLTLRNVTVGQSGTYSVLVVNSSGNAAAAALVTITNPPPRALFAAPAFSGSNGLLLNLSVSVGNTYRFQASTNLADWSTLATLYANGTNTVCFDPSAAAFRARFYRLVSP